MVFLQKRKSTAADVYQTVKRKRYASNPQSHFKRFQRKTTLGFQWTVSMDRVYVSAGPKKQTTEAIRFNWDRKNRMIYQSASRNPRKN